MNWTKFQSSVKIANIFYFSKNICNLRSDETLVNEVNTLENLYYPKLVILIAKEWIVDFITWWNEYQNDYYKWNKNQTILYFQALNMENNRSNINLQ